MALGFGLVATLLDELPCDVRPIWRFCGSPSKGGTFVRKDSAIVACEGSFMSGRGPPPWVTAITGARVVAGIAGQISLGGGRSRGEESKQNSCAGLRDSAYDALARNKVSAKGRNRGRRSIRRGERRDGERNTLLLYQRMHVGDQSTGKPAFIHITCVRLHAYDILQ